MLGVGLGGLLERVWESRVGLGMGMGIWGGGRVGGALFGDHALRCRM